MLRISVSSVKIKLGMKYLCMICSKYFAGIDNLFKHIAEAHDTIPEHFLFDKQIIKLILFIGTFIVPRMNKINLIICLSYLKKKKSGSGNRREWYSTVKYLSGYVHIPLKSSGLVYFNSLSGLVHFSLSGWVCGATFSDWLKRSVKIKCTKSFH